MRQIVATVHGIETRGKWQKEVAPLLCQNGMTPYLLDYGRFAASRLISPRRDRMVYWLNRELEAIKQREQVDRISLIAHSFGTYMLASLMEKFDHTSFHKVILCGSIVDRKFPWQEYVQSGRLGSLRNETGGQDIWCQLSRLGKFAIPRIGPSGIHGFNATSERVANINFKGYKHSDYFEPGHARSSWIPFLRGLSLNDADNEAFRQLLSVTIARASTEIGVDISKMRANIMVPTADRESVHIPGALHFPDHLFATNPAGERELDIVVPIGMGSAGLAYQANRMVIARFASDWGQNTLPDSELRKVNPLLRWIVSVPVVHGKHDVSEIIGILNLDCLEIERDPAELAKLAEILKYAANEISKWFERLFIGGT